MSLRELRSVAPQLSIGEWAQALDSPSGLGQGSFSSIAKTAAPAHGAKTVQNGRSVLEDAFTVVPDLCSLVPRGCGDEDNTSVGTAYDEQLSYFGVFDGHGGVEAAQHCASRMHYNVYDALAKLATQHVPDASCCSQLPWSKTAPEVRCDSFNASEASCATEMDIDQSGCPAQNAPAGPCTEAASSPSPANPVIDTRNSHAVCHALKQAFLKNDEELAGTEIGELVGSTAVIAVVGKTDVWVAHCGDSRAVLSRKGVALSLTQDHKPDRKDEAERILAAGGKVLHKGGSHRVMGLLAMSRAIGDHFLRPYVIPEPEVTTFQRTGDDELLLLATDGLWDVLQPQEAMSLALRSLQRACERGASRSAACRVGASVLTKAAIERGSRDNITVVLIDMRPSADTPTLGALLATHGSGEAARVGSCSSSSNPPQGSSMSDSALLRPSGLVAARQLKHSMSTGHMSRRAAVTTWCPLKAPQAVAGGCSASTGAVAPGPAVAASVQAAEPALGTGASNVFSPAAVWQQQWPQHASAVATGHGGGLMTAATAPLPGARAQGGRVSYSSSEGQLSQMVNKRTLDPVSAALQPAAAWAAAAGAAVGAFQHSSDGSSSSSSTTNTDVPAAFSDAADGQQQLLSRTRSHSFSSYELRQVVTHVVSTGHGEGGMETITVPVISMAPAQTLLQPSYTWSPHV